MPRMTLGALAEKLGLDRKTLQRWRKRGAPFVPGPGNRAEADVDELLAWARRHGLDGSMGRPIGALTGCVSSAAKAEVAEETGASVSELAAAAAAVDDALSHDGDSEGVSAALKRKLAEAELRKRLAAAGKAELDLERARGELLSAAEVQRGRLERIAVVRKGLLDLPGKVGRLPDCGPTAEAETRAEVEALLAEFARA